MIFLKKKGNRYYKEDRFNFRSFPIKKVEAEKILAEGKAELIERFAWEPTPTQEEQSIHTNINVVDFNEARKKKQESKELQEAVLKFKNEYLPFITYDEMQNVLSAKNKEEYGERIVKACMRIDLEKQI